MISFSSVKGQIINILGFEGHTVSFATTQLWHQSTQKQQEGWSNVNEHMAQIFNKASCPSKAGPDPQLPQYTVAREQPVVCSNINDTLYKIFLVYLTSTKKLVLQIY